MGLRLWLSMGAPVAPGERRRPLLLSLDADTGATEAVRVPIDDGAPEDHAELTAGELRGDVLWQPTRASLLWLDAANGRVLDRFSHPLFHDLHHVLPLDDGGFAVAASGIESVLVFGPDRALRAHHFLRGGSFEEAYPGVSDFSRLPCDRFKPHTHHPNFVFERAGALWATVWGRFAAWELAGEGRLPLGDAWPHDGRLREGLLWFTTVEGEILAYDPHSLQVKERWDLRVIDPRPGLKGWCRGVEVVGDRLFVGLTSLRGTRRREVARRLLRGAEGVKWPTRLLEIDRRSGALVREYPLPGGKEATVFAINAMST